MADVTDVAFRALVAKRGAPDVYWTEFVSADGLYHMREMKKMPDAENPLMRDLQFSEAERPIVAQLFSTYLIDYVDPKNKAKRKWKESKNDHLFDLCKYAYATGSFLGFTRIATDARKAIEAAKAAAAAKQAELPLAQPAGGKPIFRNP